MTIYSQISANKRRSYLILLLFVFIFSGFFYVIGSYSNQGEAYFFLGFAISFFSSWISYYYSDKIVLATLSAKPANKQEYFDFYTVVENLCVASGLPMPRIYVIDDPSPNAFATGRDPKHATICATSGLLEILERSELEGVVAHELSHVKNYDILVSTVVAVLVGTIAMVSDFLMRNLWWGGLRRRDDDDNRGGNPIMFIFFILAITITPLVGTLIQLAISRRREFLADADGALLTRYPAGLANALEKISSAQIPLQNVNISTAHLFISNPLKNNANTNWIAKLFSTHPPIQERIKILRSM